MALGTVLAQVFGELEGTSSIWMVFCHSAETVSGL
jgi:hypothetical protein